MRTGLFLVFLLAALLPACDGDPAAGSGDEPAGFLDAAFEFTERNLYLPIGSTDCAQGFTVIQTGRLTAVQLILENLGVPGILRIDVRPAPAGVVSEDNVNVLGFVEFDVTTLSTRPDYVTVDFGGQIIDVQAGDELAIVARRVTGTDEIVNIYGQSGNPYAGGSAHRRGSGVWSVSPIVDFGFRTFVEPDVP